MSHRLLSIAICVAAAIAGCRQKMAEQPRYEPLEASRYFGDGTSARPPLAETIARGQWPREAAYATGMTLAAGGELPETPTLLRTSDYAIDFPLPLTRELVLRGRERFQIYCAPCHGKDATGAGPVVEHGFPRPPSLQSTTLKNAPAGYLFDVVARGLRDMPEFRNRIPLRDRWAVVAYVRAMQQAGSAEARDAELIAAAKGLAVAEGAANDDELRQKGVVPTDAGSGRAARSLNLHSERDLGVEHAASN